MKCKLTGMPPLQEIPAPVITKTRLLLSMQAASSVIRGSITSEGSDMTIFTFIINREGKASFLL
jgi:hypothetical protein